MPNGKTKNKAQVKSGLKPVTPDMLLDSLKVLHGLGGHFFEEMGELSLEQQAELENTANTLQENFMREAAGHYNGAVLVAALFIAFKVSHQYQRDAGILKDGGATLIQ